MERVWDPFLTAEDREHALQQPRTPTGIGQRPALLLIDLYRKVFGDKREPKLAALEQWPSSCGLSGWDALPHISRLLLAARSCGIPVIHVTGASDIPGWRRVGPRQTKQEIERGYAIVDEVEPTSEEPVIRKSASSAFFGTPLIALLGHHKVDHLIVTGESTSGCVRATVVDARSYRINVTVVEECVFDRVEASHAINLFDMAQKYADVEPVDDVIRELFER